MDEERLLVDERLGYTQEMRELYLRAVESKIPAVRPFMGQFLSFVVALHNPRRILEIGTGSGYSTLWLLRFLSESGRIVTLERDENRYRDALSLFYQKPITVYKMDVFDFFAQTEEVFDLVFLDAEKRIYPRVLPLITEHLEVGGILVVDNLFGIYLHKGREERLPAAGALEEFYEKVVSSSQYRVFAFGWEDGILVAQRVA